MISTLGPKVYKYYLLWAIWIPRGIHLRTWTLRWNRSMTATGTAFSAQDSRIGRRKLGTSRKDMGNPAYWDAFQESSSSHLPSVLIQSCDIVPPAKLGCEHRLEARQELHEQNTTPITHKTDILHLRLIARRRGLKNGARGLQVNKRGRSQ